MAYPKADLSTINIMAKDRFIRQPAGHPATILDLCNPTLRLSVRCLYRYGLEVEACMKPLQQSQKARVAGSTMAEELATLRQEIRKQGEESKKGRDETAALRKRLENRPTNWGPARSANGKLLCYYCGEEGHFKRECPSLRGRY